MVYHVNKVFPPDVYSSVVAPVLFSDKTSIMYKAIYDYEFNLYLNSMAMDGMEGYSLLVPTDEYMTNYIDPIAYGSAAEPAVLRFIIGSIGDGATTQIVAVVHKYDPLTGIIGDSITQYPDLKLYNNNSYKAEYNSGCEFVKNRIIDILDSHIIVEDVSKGGYFLTKGGQMLYVKGDDASMTFQGGGDVIKNKDVRILEENGELHKYDQTNGKTYFIDKPIETPMQSVYKVMKDDNGELRGAFSEFFELCEGFPSMEIFDIGGDARSPMDYNVKFFNTYNYTVFVPSNEAVKKAIEDRMITPWEDTMLSDGTIIKGIDTYRIEGADGNIESQAKADTLIKKLERFVRYHFQDNAVFIDDMNPINSLKTNQTATIKLDDSDSKFDTYQNKYYKLGTKSISDGLGGMTLEIIPEITKSGNYNAKVIKSQNGVKTHNILAKDFVFGSKLANITNLRSQNYRESRITTSSVAVIHLIDNVLYFKEDLDCAFNYNSAE